ncbi:MAG: hypothetical protein AB9907_17725 [Flexilinea sp.]
MADVKYLINTTDKQAILEVAQKKYVNGIIAYVSNLVAPIAAWIFENLGLSGNPYEFVDVLTDKSNERQFYMKMVSSAPKLSIQ